MKTDYMADNLGVRGKNLGFMQEPRFAAAWERAVEGNKAGWNGSPPDIRWRAHTALWAAEHALGVDGDFVEAGVFLGFLSLTICHALDFNRTGRKFYLFDTFNGIPEDGTEATALKNKDIYFDCYDEATKNFAPFENVHLVRGMLPDSLAAAPIEKIAYLSVDLNQAAYEIAVAKELWERLSPSAIVLLDDYAHGGHEEQYNAWNEFTASRNISILTLPTGQGLIIKPGS